MKSSGVWQKIVAEAQGAFLGQGRFPVRAYSEFMPPPYIGFKPYAPDPSSVPATVNVRCDDALDIDEYEQANELRTGLAKIAQHLVTELGKLVAGPAHEFPKALLEGNLAWPPILAAAAHAGRIPRQPFFVIEALALSRTQDDKGNVRWTLFGSSHLPAATVFWRSFADGDQDRFLRLLAWANGGSPGAGGLAVFDPADLLPGFARDWLWRESAPVRTLFTLQPFATLPESLQKSYLAGALRILPTPASHVFAEHPLYRKLGTALPHAQQIPLLHLFPRSEGRYTIRIPQSGWLDEHDPSQPRSAGAERVVHQIARSHRWQRTERDQDQTGDGSFTDKVTVAFFSTKPDDLGLYGKPMACNSQIWTHDYQLLLNGPVATPAELERAAQRLDRGGRFGYRCTFPPMRAGTRELFWHLPLLARLGPDQRSVEVFTDSPPLGQVTAEAADANPLVLAGNLLDRPGHREAAGLFVHEPGHPLHTTAHNLRKLFDFREYLGGPLPDSFARALLRVSKATTIESWLAKLPQLASDPEAAKRLGPEVRACIGPAVDPGPDLTFYLTGMRAFETALWRTIASLAEGEFRHKETADRFVGNQGRTGGAIGLAAKVEPSGPRDLDQLAQYLREGHRAAIQRHRMQGRAQVFDHAFTWRSDFDLSWSEAWSKNHKGESQERNLVVVIPGKNRGEAVIMADHYDTAYMEDVYEKERGGDGLRAAAAGADDNHSATATLLLAADLFLPLAREGKLERDIWLVHLTGEEFPSDCLGARALGQALVEKSLRLQAEDGTSHDLSAVRVVGAYVLDMIGHNNHHDLDVFQIASGEGAGSARLALHAHLANQRWNRQARAWNATPERQHLGRAQRGADGQQVPAPFAHLPVAG
ncbi:MAG TPA: M28 family peptidase, partial [Polyangia bacterium]